MKRLAIVVAAACLSTSAAQAERLPKSEWLPRSEWYAYACGQPDPSLKFCQREIRRVNAEMKRLEAYSRRTGNGYGTGFTHCAADCVDSYPSLKDKFK